MEAWVALAKQHLANNPSNFKKRRSTMSVFVGHIAQTPSISRSPADYFDARHRPDPLFHIEGTRGRQTMTVVYQFLEEVLFKVCTQTDECELPILRPGFANPLQRPTYRRVNKGETHREPMPSRLIRQALSILTENDFAWARGIGRLSDAVRWQNPQTDDFESMWSPVRAYALLAKLLLPARSGQVRHLDSGEGDSLRYEVDGRWVPNAGNHAPAAGGVERGVFRRYRRKDDSWAPSSTSTPTRPPTSTATRQAT